MWSLTYPMAFRKTDTPKTPAFFEAWLTVRSLSESHIPGKTLIANYSYHSVLDTTGQWFGGLAK